MLSLKTYFKHILDSTSTLPSTDSNLNKDDKKIGRTKILTIS